MCSKLNQPMNIESAKYLAIQLMDKHGLLSSGWHFQLDSSMKRFGVCSYRRKLISMSRHLIELNDEADVKDTILHEIAHALTRGAKHGPVWKAKCVEIGCKPVRCYSVKNIVQPKMRYQAKCGACGVLHQRVKALSALAPRRSCGCQSGPWDNRVLLTYIDTKKVMYL